MKVENQFADEADHKSERAKKEEEILKFWRENKIFEQTLAKPALRGDFVFYEGPPTANGRPGIHHIEARAFKDLIPRFKTMQGYHVRRKAGWDTHGLPVELEVEKELGLKSKKEIENYGVVAFNQKCRANVWKYLAEWQKFTERMGYWIDQEHPYVTYTPDYIESVWAVIKESNNQKLLYQDYKVLPWCPRCGTALSSHELAQGYKEVKDPALFVKFKVKPGQKIGEWTSTDKTYFVAWTTTPWTLPGNVALAVGEEIEYAVFQNGDEYFIATREFDFFTPSDVASPELASPRSSDLLAPGSARPLAKPVLASQLIGLEYEPLYPYLKDNLPPGEREKLSKAFKVYGADFVSTGEGTGVVHTAVMYGADDFELGTKIGLPKFHLVNVAGEFIAGIGELSGKFVKEADVDIMVDLKKRGLLFKQEKITHTYPFCWRCQTPLIYYARDSWYIRMLALREELLAENEKINWIPAHIKNGRFGEWLREVKDWAISRERYWGTPLPVWQSESGGETVVIGSLAELKRLTKRSGNRYFVMRHGEAEHNVLRIINSGDTNLYHLTNLGRDQVRSAAVSLRGEKITCIYTSPFLRARESAEIIADELGITRGQILSDDRLREFNFGQLDGRPFADFLDYESKKMLLYSDSAPAGESYLEAKRRFGNFIYEIEANLTGETILIVTHGIGPEVLEAIIRGADAAESKQIINTLEPSVAKPYELLFIPLPHNADYELDFHRPFIDEVELIGESGTVLKRVPEVLDVWFDSGAMPLAQDHYPFNLADGKPKEILYPADFIAEAIDQTRGWFYTLLAIGVLLKRGLPSKNVICLGHILDHEGKKMSKSIGNIVDPWLMIDKYGIDALRFWMYAVNPSGESKNFDETGVMEVVRKIINPLMNVLAFYELYRGEAIALPAVAPASPHILDEWLVALEEDLTPRVTKHLEDYQITEAARLLREFIAQLSQWYLRRSRDRIKNGDAAALAVLHHALFDATRLLAPFMPFLAEDIYRRLRQVNDPISVHLTSWPKVENKKPASPAGGREALLPNMVAVRVIASLGLEARARAGLKIRQPLRSLRVRGSRPTNLAQDFILLIKGEVNVKDVEWHDDLRESVELDLTITPELRAEGQVREFIRQVQDLRKQKGLLPRDRIILFITVSDIDRVIIESSRAEICRVAGADAVHFSPGETMEIRLERA